MQAPVLHWNPPTGVLGGLLTEAAGRVAALREERGRWEERAAHAPTPHSFLATLRRTDVAIVAEVKRRSPSRGPIAVEIAAGERARAYATGGAAAISVLTEPRHFGGSGADLEAVSRAVELPVLRKDFLIDPLQVAEARALGAAAVLLIARALDPGRFREMLRAAADYALDALVEVRTEAELDLALAEGARLIGVNNRNLETLDVDTGVSERIVPMIPADVIAVAESAVERIDDVRRAALAGADAVLVGSSLSAAADPINAVRRLTGIARAARGG